MRAATENNQALASSLAWMGQAQDRACPAFVPPVRQAIPTATGNSQARGPLSVAAPRQAKPTNPSRLRSAAGADSGPVKPTLPSKDAAAAKSSNARRCPVLSRGRRRTAPASSHRSGLPAARPTTEPASMGTTTAQGTLNELCSSRRSAASPRARAITARTARAPSAAAVPRLRANRRNPLGTAGAVGTCYCRSAPATAHLRTASSCRVSQLRTWSTSSRLNASCARFCSSSSGTNRSGCPATHAATS